MRASPLQAKTIGFVSINVEPRKLEDEEPRGPSFEWEGVNIGSRISIMEKPDGAEGPNMHLLMLEVTINESEAGRVLAPYNLKVAAWGAFEYLDEDTNETEALDIVVVNGVSMLYSAIREMVSTLTARMPNRQLMLPTATFVDQKPSSKSRKSGEKKTAGRKTVAKKVVIPQDR